MTNEVVTKPCLTGKELFEALMIISDSAKALAQEVLLIPDANEVKGKEGTQNG